MSHLVLWNLFVKSLITVAISQHFTYQNKKNNTTQWHKSSQWSCGQLRISELKPSSAVKLVLHYLHTQPEPHSCFIWLMLYCCFPKVMSAGHNSISSHWLSKGFKWSQHLQFPHVQHLEDPVSKGRKVKGASEAASNFVRYFWHLFFVIKDKCMLMLSSRRESSDLFLNGKRPANVAIRLQWSVPTHTHTHTQTSCGFEKKNQACLSSKTFLGVIH